MNIMLPIANVGNDFILASLDDCTHLWVQRRGADAAEGPFNIASIATRLSLSEDLSGWTTIVCSLVFSGNFMPFLSKDSIECFKARKKVEISDETLAKICLPYPFTENGVSKFVFFATAVVLGGRLYAITGPLPHDSNVAYNALLIENWHMSPPLEEGVDSELPKKTDVASAGSHKALKTPKVDTVKKAAPALNGQCNVA
ncbi:MAG: hypothetical protein LBH53_02465 [Puniceicoccales bacterium]|nr:hypothetical protein [Puniceicoccales bacterium]